MLIRSGATSFARDGAPQEAAAAQRSIGGAPAVLLAACRGEQAALARMQAAFAELTNAGEHAASAIVAAAAPADAAAILLAGRELFAAASGTARLYAQRDHVLAELAPGRHEAALSVLYLVTSAPLPRTGDDFFGTGPGFQLGELMIRKLADEQWIELLDGTFRNDTLDAMLERSLERAPVQAIAAAALLLGFANILDAELAPAAPLRADMLEAAAAVAPAAALALLARCAGTAPDYAGLPAAIKDLHAVDFLASQVGRHGTGLERVLRQLGPRPGFLAQSLAGLDRVGAARHRAIVLAAIPMLAHFEPGLAEPMRALGLAPVPAANQWTLSNEWGDAPDLLALAAWHVAHALPDFAMDAPPPRERAPLVPPRELVSTPSRDELLAQIGRRIGRELGHDTPLHELEPTALASIEEAFALGPRVYGRDDTVTVLLHRIYDQGRPWALTEP